MRPEDQYFKELTQQELWKRYCGFLDLEVKDFMAIQEELLLDQLDRVWPSRLGKKILGKSKPGSVEEFRQIVPLTTYDDYESELADQNADAELRTAEQTVFHGGNRPTRIVLPEVPGLPSSVGRRQAAR